MAMITSAKTMIVITITITVIIVTTIIFSKSTKTVSSSIIIADY